MQVLRGPQDHETGFTLAELLVVIVIVGILAAITVPVFLNQRKKANDAAVKADLKSAAILMEDAVIDLGGYPSSIPAGHAGSKGVTLSLAGGGELPESVQHFVAFSDACNAYAGASCSLVTQEEATSYLPYGTLVMEVPGYSTLWLPAGSNLGSRVGRIGYTPVGHSTFNIFVPPAGTPLSAQGDPNTFCIEGEHANGTGVFHIASDSAGVQSGACA